MWPCGHPKCQTAAGKWDSNTPKQQHRALVRAWGWIMAWGHREGFQIPLPPCRDYRFEFDMGSHGQPLEGVLEGGQQKEDHIKCMSSPHVFPCFLCLDCPYRRYSFITIKPEKLHKQKLPGVTQWFSCLNTIRGCIGIELCSCVIAFISLSCCKDKPSFKPRGSTTTILHITSLYRPAVKFWYSVQEKTQQQIMLFYVLRMKWPQNTGQDEINICFWTQGWQKYSMEACLRL